MNFSKSALFIRSENLQSKSTPNERIIFVSLCNNIINANPDDEACLNSLIEFISSIGSYETLSYVINSEKISDIDKYQRVGWDEDVILDILNSTPDTEKQNWY